MQRILPAYPLFVKDPNFSIWSVSDYLNETNTQNWAGDEKKIYGFIKVDGKTYCFMGNASDFSDCGVEKAVQTELSVTAFTTDYAFKAGNATLKLSFVSPLTPNDIMLASMPVTYMEYEVTGVKSAEVSLFINRRIAYNDLPDNANKSVRCCVIPFNGFEAACVGLRRQMPLSNTGDPVGADWGYFYLSGEKAYVLDEKDMAAYLAAGYKNFSGDGEEKYISSINGAKKGAVLVAYDDVVSINYFGDFLKGYYLSRHNITEAITFASQNITSINKQLSDFDADLKNRAKPYGDEYYNVLVASLRQSVAAHKIVEDTEGNILFLSKECRSNGCIGTVDISYPAMPLYLIYNPELVKGTMRPVLKFAKMPVWKYDFAPHDVGTYPFCSGQVYGMNCDKTHYHGNYVKSGEMETNFPIYLLPAEFDAYRYESQMPVEESANLLIMFLAVYEQDKDINFFKQNLSLAEKWVKYLINFGLKPENQLCTDDFAGHLANNLNLAIKATVGIAAYAKLVGVCGNGEEQHRCRSIAESFAKEITDFANKHEHMPLTWDSGDETYAIKYNFAFDKILKLNLFAQELLEKEVDFYLQKNAKFGTPLDSRKDFVKSDWVAWTASLSNSVEKRKKLIAPINTYLKEGVDRIPFSDWYGAESGKTYGFRNRAVQGGCFILLL